MKEILYLNRIMLYRKTFNLGLAKRGLSVSFENILNPVKFQDPKDLSIHLGDPGPFSESLSKEAQL